MQITVGNTREFLTGTRNVSSPIHWRILRAHHKMIFKKQISNATEHVSTYELRNIFRNDNYFYWSIIKIIQYFVKITSYITKNQDFFFTVDQYFPEMHFKILSKVHFIYSIIWKTLYLTLSIFSAKWLMLKICPIKFKAKASIWRILYEIHEKLRHQPSNTTINPRFSWVNSCTGFWRSLVVYRSFLSRGAARFFRFFVYNAVLGWKRVGMIALICHNIVW